jgi:hypothetical protein
MEPVYRNCALFASHLLVGSVSACTDKLQNLPRKRFFFFRVAGNRLNDAIRGFVQRLLTPFSRQIAAGISQPLLEERRFITPQLLGESAKALSGAASMTAAVSITQP